MVLQRISSFILHELVAEFGTEHWKYSKVSNFSFFRSWSWLYEKSKVSRSE